MAYISQLLVIKVYFIAQSSDFYHVTFETFSKHSPSLVIPEQMVR